MFHGEIWRGTSPSSSSLSTGICEQIPSMLGNHTFSQSTLRMAGMRDVVIHGYFGVDNAVIWKTIKDDIPGLKDKIKKILDEIETD